MGNENIIESKLWWGAKRKLYNIGLVVAGIVAFICYVIAFQTKIDKLGSEAEITIFTILFQGIGYLIMMGIANICYNLGSITERIFQPEDTNSFRENLFKIGFWFSVALPFSIPVLVLLS